jgi:hypothetical protein
MKLNPRVKAVEPMPDYRLRLTFTNGEVRVFDMTPYLKVGVFRELQDIKMFNSVRPFLGSIQWRNEADLCPDTLYECSILEPMPKRLALQIAETPARFTARRRK